jgi:hypothetical protein
MKIPGKALPDSELAMRVAKLWPHREHKSNSALGYSAALVSIAGVG